MDKVKILGVRSFDFTTKDGKHFSGTKYFFGEQIVNHGSGLSCDSFNLSDTYDGYRPRVGEEVQLYYNKFGKVCEISPLVDA